MRRSPACLPSTRDPGFATHLRSAATQTWPLILLLAFAAGALSAQQPQIPCYTIAATPSSGSGGGCTDIAVASDGCGLLSVTGQWVCSCPFLPGTVTVGNWGMAVGTQSCWVEVPGVFGYQGLVPEFFVDLTQTGGHFGLVLPPPPTLSGLTVFVQLGAYVWGTTNCALPFAWHLTDTYQVSFT